MRKLFSLDQEKHIKKQYLGGRSGYDLANQYKVNRSTITNILRRQGVATLIPNQNFRKFQKQNTNQIIVDYQAGSSITQLAKQFSGNSRWVRKILEENKIQIRKKKPFGTKIKSSAGYIQIVIDQNSPYKSMAHNRHYVLEHRLIMAEHIGRPLTSNETVHHINGDRKDNRIENLQLCKGRHGNGSNMRCRSCGSEDIEFAKLAVA